MGVVHRKDSCHVGAVFRHAPKSAGYPIAFVRYSGQGNSARAEALKRTAKSKTIEGTPATRSTAKGKSSAPTLIFYKKGKLELTPEGVVVYSSLGFRAARIVDKVIRALRHDPSSLHLALEEANIELTDLAIVSGININFSSIELNEKFYFQIAAAHNSWIGNQPAGGNSLGKMAKDDLFKELNKISATDAVRIAELVTAIVIDVQTEASRYDAILSQMGEYIAGRRPRLSFGDFVDEQHRADVTNSRVRDRYAARQNKDEGPEDFFTRVYVNSGRNHFLNIRELSEHDPGLARALYRRAKELDKPLRSVIEIGRGKSGNRNADLGFEPEKLDPSVPLHAFVLKALAQRAASARRTNRNRKKSLPQPR